MTAPLPTAPSGPEVIQQIRRKVARGAAFMVLGRLAIRSLSVVNTLVLVRLLLPSDFGLIALAGAAITLADTLTATGFDVVLVRRATVERSAYDTAWTLNLLRCLLFGGLVSATAPWQADLLGDARLGPVLQVIALTIALDGLTSIGLIELQRQLRFELLFRYQVRYRVIAFLATNLLAWATHSYWCLVLGNLMSRVAAIPYSYWLAPYLPRLRLSHWRELLGFSKWMVLQNLCTVADGQAANLVLGRLVGVNAVGMFNVSYQIAAAPVTELAVPVRGPIYSGYAQIQHDLGLLRRQFLDGLALLVAVLMPLCAGIALVAPEIERLALGPAWKGAATAIALCTLYAFADAIAHFVPGVFAVLNRQARLTAIQAGQVALRLPLMILAAAWYGFDGVLVMLLATGVLNAVVWQWHAARLLGFPLRVLQAELWRSFAAASVMSVAVLGLRGVLPTADAGTLAAAWHLVCFAAMGATVHVGTQWLLWQCTGAPPGAEARLAAMAVHAWRRALSWRAGKVGRARTKVAEAPLPRPEARPLERAGG